MKLTPIPYMAGLLLAASSLLAQEKAVPPSGPLIQKVPAFADWSVDYKYASDDKSSRKPAQQEAMQKSHASIALKIRKERVIKTRDIAYFSWEDETGAKEECWLVAGLQWFTPKGQQKREIVRDQDNAFFISNLPMSAFEGFEWISVTQYAGTKHFMGRECLVFQTNTPQRLAYIDAVTRLPAFLKTDESVRNYTFAPPPSQMLAIPDDIVQYLREEAEQTAKIMKPGAR
jgi:hypothetical protein